VAIVLVIVIVAAGLACAVLARGRQDLQRRLGAATEEQRQADERLAALTAERDQLRESQEWFSSANARAVAEADRQRERADDLERRQREREAAEAAQAAEAAEAATNGTPDAAGAGADDDGVWLLLLTQIARRWGAMVGVPPAGRAVTDGSAADQLREAVARETERLREEVGVDVEVVVAPPEDPAAPRLGDNPADRVPALLAAVELLGVLAASAQQVTVTIGSDLVLVGEGWYDDGELAAVRDRAAAAGAAVGPVVADEEAERAQVVVRASAEVPAGS
jgi:hypothetical protein